MKEYSCSKWKLNFCGHKGRNRSSIVWKDDPKKKKKKRLLTSRHNSGQPLCVRAATFWLMTPDHIISFVWSGQ